MPNTPFSRRTLLQTAAAGTAAFAGGGQPVQETAPSIGNLKPEHSIRFAAIGLDHIHINFIVDALKRGGGQLVWVHSTSQPLLSAFLRRYPEAKVAQSEDEILNDPSIQVIGCASIPDLRAGLGIRAMRHGKDFLADKPAVTTLEQLEEVRKVTRETGKLFGILYSERLVVRAATYAAELVKNGAIGKVVQTINIAPHQLNEPIRPPWFWESARFGGILCDIGSHQVDDFLFYTGSTTAEVTAAQVANVNHKHRVQFHDFGDMMMHGNGGFGYLRVDWFTPNGLGTWGDGRVFILGTEGYIEMRKYIDVANPGHSGGDHLLLVDRKQARYIDCKGVGLPFGVQFVGDVVNRTHVAQNQEQAFLAAELAIKGQRMARVLS